MAAASATVRDPVMDKRVLVVVMLLARLTSPLVENPPGAVILPVELLVNSPELVTEMLAPGPLLADEKLLLTAKLVPFRVAEPINTVLPKVVTPLAAFVWVNAP